MHDESPYKFHEEMTVEEIEKARRWFNECFMAGLFGPVEVITFSTRMDAERQKHCQGSSVVLYPPQNQNPCQEP